MQNSITYFAVLALSLVFPLAFSFHPSIRFSRHFRQAFTAIILVAIPFICWDIWFTRSSVWSFNNERVIGWQVFDLPLEEILFFIIIPFCCLFTYYVIKHKTTFEYSWKYLSPLLLVVIVLLTAIAFINLNRLYTSVTFLLCSILLLITLIRKPSWMPKYLLSYTIILVPFFITNGILTGSWIDTAVVRYNDQHNLGIRLLTIPVEDIFFGLSLTLLSTFLFEKLKATDEKKATHPDFSV